MLANRDHMVGYCLFIVGIDECNVGDEGWCTQSSSDCRIFCL